MAVNIDFVEAITLGWKLSVDYKSIDKKQAKQFSLSLMTKYHFILTLLLINVKQYHWHILLIWLGHHYILMWIWETAIFYVKLSTEFNIEAYWTEIQGCYLTQWIKRILRQHYCLAANSSWYNISLFHTYISQLDTHFLIPILCFKVLPIYCSIIGCCICNGSCIRHRT
jgi:hypothetical protein